MKIQLEIAKGDKLIHIPTKTVWYVVESSIAAAQLKQSLEETMGRDNYWVIKQGDLDSFGLIK